MTASFFTHKAHRKHPLHVPGFDWGFAENTTNRDAYAQGNGHDMRYRKLAGAVLELAIRDTIAGGAEARQWLLSADCNAILDGLLVDDAVRGSVIVAALDGGRLTFDLCLRFDGVPHSKM